MSIQNVQNAVENTTSVFDNLPQYAALITSFVAISLFIIKEVIEYNRKIKARKNNIEAARLIVSMKAYSLLRTLVFIYEIFEQSKEADSIEIKHNPLIARRKITFKHGDKKNTFLVIPSDINQIDTYMLLDISKISKELLIETYNLNNAIIHINNYLELILQHILDENLRGLKVILSIIINSRNGNDLFKSAVDDALVFEKELSMHNGSNKTITKVIEILSKRPH